MSVSAMQLYFSQYQSPMESRGPMNLMPDEPLKPRVTREAEDIYRKHRQGTGVAFVIGGGLTDNTWVPIHNPAWAHKRKKKPKNFLDANKTHVKKVQENVENNRKELEEKRKELDKPLWKSDKYNGIQSKVAEHIKTNYAENNPDLALPLKTHRRTKSAEPGQLINDKTDNIVPNAQVIANGGNIVKPKGILVDGTNVSQTKGETVNDNNIAQPKRQVINQRPASDKKPTSSGKRSSSAQRRSAKNFLRINLNSAGKTSEKRSRSETALDNLHKKREEEFKQHKKGEIPPYLKERKLSWQKLNEKLPQSDCPPGHILMPLEEKEKTLERLRKAEQEILSKYNHLPVRTDTTFLVRKKAEYQKRLGEVEEAIKIFSKPKVFIRQDVANEK